MSTSFPSKHTMPNLQTRQKTYRPKNRIDECVLWDIYYKNDNHPINETAPCERIRKQNLLFRNSIAKKMTFFCTYIDIVIVIKVKSANASTVLSIYNILCFNSIIFYTFPNVWWQINWYKLPYSYVIKWYHLCGVYNFTHLYKICPLLFSVGTLLLWRALTHNTINIKLNFIIFRVIYNFDKTSLILSSSKL